MSVRKPTTKPLNKKRAGDPLLGKALSNSDKCEIQDIETIYAEEFEPESPEDFKILRQLAEARWKMRRADEMEVDLFTSNMPEDEKDPDMALAIAFMKDAGGARILGKIITYRERAENAYYRALKLLRARKKGIANQSAQPAAHVVAQPARLMLIHGRKQRGQTSEPGSPLKLVHGSKRPPNVQ